MSGKTRPPFRRSFVPRCHPERPTGPQGADAETSPPLPCSALAREDFSNKEKSSQLLLERLSQSTAFESPRYQSVGTAEPPAAAANLPGLVMGSVPRVTLLGGPTSTPSPYVPAVRPGIVSAARRCCDFWGPKLEAPPYPSVMIVRDSVPSPQGTYSQAL